MSLWRRDRDEDGVLPDEVLLASRFVDGEVLSEEERAATQRRLLEDPAFRAEVEELEAVRAALRAGDARDDGRVAPEGFAGRALDRLEGALRRSGTRSGGGEPPAATHDEPGRILVWARRVVAAAVLFALGLLAAWAGALRATQDDGRLYAAPEQVDALIEEIDAGIRAAETGEPAGGGRR